MSYIRGRYYTFKGKDMFMFGLGNVPEKIVDEFVVMRHARMTKKQIKEAEKRATKKYQGNYGCDALCKKHGKKTTMEITDKLIKEVKKAKKKK